MKTTLKIITLYLFSALLLYNPAMADQPQITVSWEYPEAPPDLAGFRVYLDDNMIQEFANPGARSWTANISMAEGDHDFEMTAYDTAGNESSRSDAVTYSHNGPPVTPVNISIEKPQE